VRLVEGCAMAKAKKKTKSRPKVIEKDTPNRFARIKDLRCYVHVEDMLYAGYPVSAVADYIQVRMNEYRDVKRTSLMQVLKMFRSLALSDSKMVYDTLPRAFATAEKNFSNKMRELERLEDGYLAMQYRFDVAHAQERMTGVMDQQADRIYRMMTDTVLKMHNIKMDLGLVGSRDLGTINVSAERVSYIKDKYGDGAAKALADPVSRGRVLAALNAMKKAGSLRDKDGEPMDYGSHMDLSANEKSQVVDIEYEAEDADLEPVKGDPVGEGGDGAGGGEDGGFVPQGEDLSKDEDAPMGYDERVEALGDVEEEEEVQQAGVSASPKKDDQRDIAMAPTAETSPHLPPGPTRPSVRGNVEDKWSSRRPRKKKP